MTFLLRDAREHKATLAFRDWKYLLKQTLGVPAQRKMPQGTKLGEATQAALKALGLAPALETALCSFFPNSDPDHEEAHVALTPDQKALGLSAADLLKFMGPVSEG